jgi:hypothetical protein
VPQPINPIEQVQDDAELDELEGPNGWKPSVQDFDGLLISTLVEDLPLSGHDCLESIEQLDQELGLLLQKVAHLHIRDVEQQTTPANGPDNTFLDLTYTPSLPPVAEISLDLQYFQVRTKSLYLHNLTNPDVH